MSKFILAFSFFFVSQNAAFATTFFNERISVQGYLRTSSGALASNSYTMKFTIKNAGTAVWTKTYNSSSKIVVSTGVFTAVLSGTDDFGVNLVSALFGVSANSSAITVTVAVDIDGDGSFGAADATFNNLAIVPVALALYSNIANTLPQKGAATGDFLSWDGSDWTPAQAVPNGSVDMGTKVSGILPIANGGTGASTVSAARANLGIVDGTSSVKGIVQIGSGLTASSGTIGVDVGTTSGKIASATDSRFPSATCASGNKMRWTGTAWVCETDATGNGITSLTGDVTASGTGAITATVAQVGGATAANVASATTAALAAIDTNTVSTIVKRDGSGNFSAGTVTANLSGVARESVFQASTTTAGTSTAYTLTTTPSFTPVTGDRVAFRVNVANGAAATLNVNGAGAMNLRSAVTNANLIAGVLQTTDFATAVFNGTQWLVQIPPLYGSSSVSTCAVTAANSTGECATTVTVNGAQTGQAVQCNQMAALPSGYIFGGARVSAANTVTLAMGCNNAFGCTWAATSFACTVIR